MKFTGGLPETRCGAGSTLGYTAALREALPLLLHSLGTRRLLDAPCGDANWISQVNLSGIEYVGVDSSIENLETARSKVWQSAPVKVEFSLLDILNEPLPAADTILCRDFFQHLPTPLVKWFLISLSASRIEWALLTSHDVESNAPLDRIGGFRPLDLCKPPINLPAPQYALPDGPGRILGFWENKW